MSWFIGEIIKIWHTIGNDVNARKSFARVGSDTIGLGRVALCG